MSEAPEAPESRIPVTSRPFWNAAGQGRLVLQWCRACDVPIHYPRDACPGCLGEDLEWRDASGKGAVYAFSVIERSPLPRFQDRVPFTLALVELDEGPRLMTHVVSCDPGDVAVGMRVRVAWGEADDGRALPVFEPDGAGGPR